MGRISRASLFDRSSAAFCSGDDASSAELLTVDAATAT